MLNRCFALSRGLGAGAWRRSRRPTSFSSTLRSHPSPRRPLCSRPNSDTASRKPDTSGALNWYLRQLDEKPLVTKSLTSMVIVGAGDVLCQGVLEVSLEWNVQGLLLGRRSIQPCAAIKSDGHELSFGILKTESTLCPKLWTILCLPLT